MPSLRMVGLSETLGALTKSQFKVIMAISQAKIAFRKRNGRISPRCDNMLVWFVLLPSFASLRDAGKAGRTVPSPTNCATFDLSEWTYICLPYNYWWAYLVGNLRLNFLTASIYACPTTIGGRIW